MGANNTPLYDLVELQGLNAFTTYTTSPGGGGDIIGLVDNATYTDDDSDNSSTTIEELNDTADSDNGRLFIDGMEYSIELVTPTNSFNPVTVTYDDGASSVDLFGNGYRSDVAFIQATPNGPGSVRWFMAVDDSVGDLPDITAVQTRNLDYDPSGNDVKIDLEQNNTVTICFAAGTLIDTAGGARPVEELKIGDLVRTLDHGMRPIRWIRSETLPLDTEKRVRKSAPVRIHRSALGPGMPERDLVVSPQHRVLVASKVVARMFDTPEILLPAKRLVGMPGIIREGRLDRVTYCHFYLGTHEIVFAEGALTESLLPETGPIASMDARARAEVATMGVVPPARPIIENGPQVRELLRRHRKNVKPLVDPVARNEKTRAAPVPLHLAASA